MIENGWNVVRFSLPDGQIFVLAFHADGRLRLRKFGWKPIEITPAEVPRNLVVPIEIENTIVRLAGDQIEPVTSSEFRLEAPIKDEKKLRMRSPLKRRLRVKKNGN
jgi:hypothetical protein